MKTKLKRVWRRIKLYCIYQRKRIKSFDVLHKSALLLCLVCALIVFPLFYWQLFESIAIGMGAFVGVLIALSLIICFTEPDDRFKYFKRQVFNRYKRGHDEDTDFWSLVDLIAEDISFAKNKYGSNKTRPLYEDTINKLKFMQNNYPDTLMRVLGSKYFTRTDYYRMLRCEQKQKIEFRGKEEALQRQDVISKIEQCALSFFHTPGQQKWGFILLGLSNKQQITTIEETCLFLKSNSIKGNVNYKARLKTPLSRSDKELTPPFHTIGLFFNELGFPNIQKEITLYFANRPK